MEQPAESKGHFQEEPTFKLFVYHLSTQYNEEEFRKLFEPFGEIVDTHIIMDKATNSSKGCGFIVFKTKNAADSAILAYNGIKVTTGSQSPLEVRYANPGTNSKPSTTQNRKVYVAHLPQDYDESKLREIFQSYGEIEDVFVMRDSSGKCKGSGFVKFKEIESATKAIEKLHDKFVVEGSTQPLIVRYADVKSARPAPPTAPFVPSPYPPAPWQWGTQPYPYPSPSYPPQQYPPQPYMPQQYPPNDMMYRDRSYPPMMPLPEQMQMMQMQQQQRRMGPQAETGPKRGPPGANLYVSNLPFTVSERELWDLFSPFGQILEVKLIEDRATGRSRGFGFVNFSSPESARFAVEGLNGKEINGRSIRVIERSASQKPY